MSLIERRYRSMYYNMLLNFIFFGITNTIIGALLPRILQDFQWSYAETGFILAAGSVGYFISTFLFGYLIGRFGLKITLISGLLLLAVGHLAFGLTRSVPFNLAAYLLTGVGHGALEVVINTAVVRMERKGENHLMSFMHAAFSIGAITGPLLAGAVLSAGGAWQISFRTMGILFLASAAIPFFLPFRQLQVSSTLVTIPAGDVLPEVLARQKPQRLKKAGMDFGKGTTSVILLGALTIFLYVGMEMAISNWASEYFVARFNVAANYASLVVALFWGGIFTGRVAIPLLAKTVSLTTQLLVLTSASAVAVVLISLLPGPFSAGTGILLAGLGCSGVYPLVMSLVGKYLTGNQSLGLSIVSTGGGIGGFVFPFIMALIAQQFGLVTGFGFLAGMGGLLICSSAVMFFRVRSLAQRVY